ncbi:uncharacterized protein LOC141588139 [Silene latifolia]|uniref:uncharacterized protein LOC141588139 n=1 Tax=Silene latifolia TaxID=37657 RepID=UPI003D77FF69
MDIQSTGAYFTWNNKQPTETRVYSRLDRLLANMDWINHFPGFYANFMPEGHFDHTPCVVWDTHIEGVKIYSVIKKLTKLKPVLKKFNHTHYAYIGNRADIASAKLQYLQQQIVNLPGDGDLIAQEYEKAKAHWISEGDANSSYFHRVLKARRNRNPRCLLGILSSFVRYKNSTQNINKDIVRAGNICTEEHKNILMAHVTKEEIKDIIFDIPNDKAPGPDGYSSKCFKDTWDIVGDEVSNVILDFFHTAKLLKQLNCTLITLIPKVERPTLKQLNCTLIY